MKEHMNLLKWVISAWGLMLPVGTIFSILVGGSALWLISSIPAYFCAALIYVILKNKTDEQD